MNEIAAFFLVALLAYFMIHIIQGVAGKTDPQSGKPLSGTSYITSFFSRAPYDPLTAR